MWSRVDRQAMLMFLPMLRCQRALDVLYTRGQRRAHVIGRNMCADVDSSTNYERVRQYRRLPADKTVEGVLRQSFTVFRMNVTPRPSRP